MRAPPCSVIGRRGRELQGRREAESPRLPLAHPKQWLPHPSRCLRRVGGGACTIAFGRLANVSSGEYGARCYALAEKKTGAAPRLLFESGRPRRWHRTGVQFDAAAGWIIRPPDAPVIPTPAPVPSHRKSAADM